MPFFIPVVAAVAAAKGLHSGVRGLQATSEAKKVVDLAQRADASSMDRLTEAQERANAKLEQLGRLEADVAAHELKRFVDLFSQLRGVDLSEFDVNLSVEDEVDLRDVASLANVAVSLLGSTAAGGAGGVLAGFAAYGAVGAFGTASTGTAIGTLSGAAAHSATLAWLGGGSLAAGGGGMAAGTIVLGAVVGAPVALIGGVLFDRHAQKDLAKARTYDAAVRIACAERTAIITNCNAVHTATSTLEGALTAARKPFNVVLDRLQDVIRTEGTDYRTFSDIARRAVHLALLFAQAFKALIDVPVLGEDGALLDDYRAAVHDLNDLLTNEANRNQDGGDSEGEK